MRCTRLRLNFSYIYTHIKGGKKKLCLLSARALWRQSGRRARGAIARHSHTHTYTLTKIHFPRKRNHVVIRHITYIYFPTDRNAIKCVYKFETVRLTLFTYCSNLFRTCWISSTRATRNSVRDGSVGTYIHIIHRNFRAPLCPDCGAICNIESWRDTKDIFARAQISWIHRN